MGSIGDVMDEKKTTYLIPILMDNEFDEDFLEQVKNADNILLLYVVDSKRMNDLPSGFMGGRIKSAEEIIDKYRKRFRGKNISGYVEWGSWESKLKAYALLKNVDLVLMRDCIDAHNFARILKRENVETKVL